MVGIKGLNMLGGLDYLNQIIFGNSGGTLRYPVRRRNVILKFWPKTTEYSKKSCFN